MAVATSALVVGVGLVAAITSFVAAGKQSVAGSWDAQFLGDLAVDTDAWMHGGASDDFVVGLEAAPELSAVAARRLSRVQFDGTVLDVTGWSGDVGEVFTVEVLSGSADALGGEGLAVGENTAQEHGWSVGDVVAVVFPTGERDTLEVAAVCASRTGWVAFVDRSVFEASLPDALDLAVYLIGGAGRARGGGPSRRRACRRAVPDRRAA